MPLTAEQYAVLRLHQELDKLLGRGTTAQFPSGYRTSHPFASGYLNLSDVPLVDQLRIGDYTFHSDQLRLVDAIRAFHRTADNIDYSADEVLVGPGASPLLLLFMLFLKRCAVARAHYLRPIYHTLYHFAEVLGVGMVGINDDPLWFDDATPSLPRTKEVLILADPIWIAGRPLGAPAIEEIRAWQENTGSLVFVDGTFQYLAWDSAHVERSAALLRDNTVRLVCPTKAVAVHGVRFAYLLGPPHILSDLRWECGAITGAGSAFDLATAEQIMRVLSGPQGNLPLREYTHSRYLELRRHGTISRVVVEPECSYYAFGEFLAQAGHGTSPLMSPAYFELSRPSGCVRINILSPALLAGQGKTSP